MHGKERSRFGAGMAAAAACTVSASAVSVLWHHPAAAQTIGPQIEEPADVPGNRVIPEYAPIGYDVAGFDVFPTVTFGARSDDNVFSRQQDRQADVALQAAPQLRARRKADNGSIAVDAGLRSSSYLRLPSQDAIEYSMEAKYMRGSAGFGSVTLDAGYRRQAVQRGTVENDLAIGEPLMRRTVFASMTARKRLNRLSLDGQLISVRLRWEDVRDGHGGTIDQHFRNGERYGAQAAATYEISGRTAIYTGLAYDRLDYRPSPALQNRDAANWSGTAGLRYQLSRVLYAQFAAGYRKYDFEDRSLGSISGLAVSGHLRYFPTRLLAIRGTIEQSNTTSPYDMVGAVTITAARIEAEYEMRRNVSWFASGRFTLEDYSKTSYSAQRVEVSAGPRLRFNRWLSAEGTVGYARRFVQGRAPFDRYSQVYALVSITLAR